MSRNTCAVCDAPIGISYLMCAHHWALVPRALKTDVYRTWGELTRTALTHPDIVARRSAYEAARQAAIDAVNARLLTEEERAAVRPHP
jgi:hypothetical protein